jgi:O-antigen ligase
VQCIQPRWRRLTVESVLLVWSALVLFFTFSRVGYIAFGLVVAIVILAGIGAQAQRMAARVAPRNLSGQRLIRMSGLFVGVLTLVIGALTLLFIAAAASPRLRDQLTTNYLEIARQTRFPAVYNVANHLEYAERLLYWISAFQVFGRYPLLGVGLGNAGFWFPQVMPAFGTHLPEIIHLLSPKTLTFANPKALWLRLLAETGILGFSAYLLWLVMLALAARGLMKTPGIRGLIGLAGGLALLAQVVEGFSLDTFALPQFWLMMGLLTASLSVHQRERRPMVGGRG